MKTFIQIGVAVLMAVAFTAGAQEIPRPLAKSAITISGAYTVVGSSTSNTPAADQILIPVGVNGVGFYVRVAGTNAATTTNATIRLEHVIVNATATNVIDDHTFSLSIPQNGTSGYDVYTNLLPTTVNLGNVSYLRVQSIQNTNLASIFITNFTAYVR